MTVVLDGLDAVRAAVGLELGPTEWITVESADVYAFGVATGAPVDGESVPALLVLSLTNRFMPQLLEVRGVQAGVNYGTGKVRFPATAAVGAQLRARATIDDVAEVTGGVQTSIRITVEAAGTDDPVCEVESLSRWLA